MSDKEFENPYLRITVNSIRGLCQSYQHPDLGDRIVEMIKDMLEYVEVVNKK